MLRSLPLCERRGKNRFKLRRYLAGRLYSFPLLCNFYSCFNHIRLPVFYLHNLYCQLQNFNISFDKLIVLYPLNRVREIHISGGSWDDSLIEPTRKVRRDTHDDVVPAEVFDLLKLTIRYCPNLKYVVLEQLGNGLTTGFQNYL